MENFFVLHLYLPDFNFLIMKKWKILLSISENYVYMYRKVLTQLFSIAGVCLLKY